MNYTTYSLSNGRILSNAETCYDTVHFEGDEYGWLEGHHDSSDNYILNGVVTSRPTLNITNSAAEIQANGVDVCTITGIPSEAEVTSNSTTLTADGNAIEFVTDIPGEHRVTITLWPYQDAEVVINAI